MSGSDHRHDLTDTQWKHWESFFPSLNTGVGRKIHEHRWHINGMLGRVGTIDFSGRIASKQSFWG